MSLFSLSFGLAGVCLSLALFAVVVSVRAKNCGWFTFSLAGIIASLVFAYLGWFHWATETQRRFSVALEQGDFRTVNEMLVSDDWSILPDGSVMINADDGTSAIVVVSRLPLVIRSIDRSERGTLFGAMDSRSDFVVSPQPGTNLDIEIYCTAAGGNVRCTDVAVWELVDDGFVP